MIRLTNLADYAVILMSKISQSETRLSAQDLSKSTGLPVPTVSKILNALGRSGLLASHRGIKGGFALAKEAGEISMADIVEAIDGPIALTNCADTTTGPCSYSEMCDLKPHWVDINDAVRIALDDVKLAKVASKTSAAPAASAE